MQLSKFMPLVCAAVFCAGFICVHAQDNPAQAAARAALDAKMQQLNAQQASPNMTITPSGAAMAQPAAQASAMDALQKKMAELDAQQKASSNVTAPPAVVDTAAQASAMEALQKKMAELDAQQKAQTPAASPSDNAAQAAARTALEEKIQQLNTQQAAMNAAKPAAAVQPPVAATPPANTNYPGKELGLPPITAPPLPISAQQETDLQGLLMRYEANQISPEEYQKERARILAKP